MDVTEEVVRELSEKLTKLVTKEVVMSALHYYGDVGPELLTYGVAYELGSGKLPALRYASALVKNRELGEMVKEVEELKKLLDGTIERLADTKRTSDARCTCCCVCNQENVTEVDLTFVGDLTLEFEKNYTSV
jgi:hypothetical protein